MMTKADARIIAESVALVRPDWLVSSLTSLLHEFRAKEPRDVHIAALWVAYDPQTRTPARLREDGPWWRLGSPQHDPTAAPTLPRWRDDLTDAMPAPPDVVARYAEQARQAAREATIPERPTKEKP